MLELQATTGALQHPSSEMPIAFTTEDNKGAARPLHGELYYTVISRYNVPSLLRS